MTAIVLPDIDRSTIDELKKRIPDLAEIELMLPSRKEVGRTADQAIDRLLGRSRAPVWPWIAAGIGIAAVVGVVAAWFAWFRRPAWEATEGSHAAWQSRGTGLETPAATAWPTTEPPAMGSMGAADVGLADLSIGDAPTASAARATMVRGSLEGA